MNELSLDLVIVGLALLTALTRGLFLALGDRIPVPARIQQGLRYAPMCALMAVVAPQLLLGGASMQFSIANPRLGAAVVAGAVMVWRNDMFSAMCAGMATLVLLRLLG
jgi:branched-subunit amino acid transport protein